MRLLDRYVLRNFLVPFIYCFFGFLAIWLVFDLRDNFGDFMEARVSPARVMLFYLTQLPAIILLCLPVGMLLALLYSLSRMSRSNEIISMLTAGRSVVRVLMPLIGVGLAAAAADMVLSYKLAPHADDTRRAFLKELSKGKKRATGLEQQLFRNRADNRTWYVQSMRRNSNDLHGIYILQQDPEGNIITKWYAKRAIYEPATKSWNLRSGKTVYFDTEGNIKSEDLWLDNNQKLEGWSETPWRIASSNLDPQNLSVPELREYVKFNADFPENALAPYRTYLQYRWAVPLECLVAILIAAPMGIVYSRRGVLAGVAGSIFIFAGMLFLKQLFLALGKGSRVPPEVAAWAPAALFGGIGLFLLYLRSTNREMADFLPKRAAK